MTSTREGAADEQTYPRPAYAWYVVGVLCVGAKRQRPGARAVAIMRDRGALSPRGPRWRCGR